MRCVSRLLQGLIFGYKHLISPFLPGACRFLPTCSDYAQGAIQVHGAWRGTLLATHRLCRCNPWGGAGYDPVPHNFSILCPPTQESKKERDRP